MYLVLGNLRVTEVGQPIHVRSLFSKFESVNHPIISDFLASIPDSFSDAVNRILSFSSSSSSKILEDNFVQNNRIKLHPFISKFHSEAGTMTTSVRNTAALLGESTTQIFTATHQPNLFAYGGIFKKIVLLQSLKKAVEEHDKHRKIINLFLIIDHDFMDDMWIRLAQLPSIRHLLGILELRFPISDSRRWQMVCNMPPPSRTILDQWRKQIYSWIRNSSLSQLSLSSDKLTLFNNLDFFWKEVETSYSKAKSYSDFNSFLISQIVNQIWGYDTLFVRLSDISSVFEDGFKYLISNYSKYSEALRKTENLFMRYGIDTGVSSSSYLNAPVWLHCKCGSKASAKLFYDENNQQHKSIGLVGTCMSCKKNLNVYLGHQNDLDLKEILHMLSPRAIPILLLLSRDLGSQCYVSGTGAMGYTMYGTMAYERLSINMPLIVIWPSKDIYYGFGQSEALDLLQITKQSDVFAYLEILKQREVEYKIKIKPVLEERNRHIKTGENFQKLLTNLFTLKEEQRRVRKLIKVAEKVNNAIHLMPCFIDYAVNFGIKNSETQWRQNLLENDNLAMSLLMNKKN